MKIKISIIGAFGEGLNLLNGQTIKTKIIAGELMRLYGEEEVCCIDTYGKLHNITSLFKIFFQFAHSQNIMMLPAHNALKILAPWLSFCNKFYHRRLHYVVIGGWLDSYLNNHPSTEKSLRKFNSIYVETQTMLNALQKRGFKNVSVLPNCKDLKILNDYELFYSTKEPFRMVTFSRVMKQKGIEVVAHIISEINNELGRRVFELDIYGQIEPNEKKWFEDFVNRYKLSEECSAIKYKGCVPFDRSIEILSQYFALLFPTRFYTEGIPGTIIDAYAAGLPVISARWESFADVIDDNVTGIGFDFENWEELKNILFSIASNPDIINSKKIACLKRAYDFLPSKVISKIKLR